MYVCKAHKNSKLFIKTGCTVFEISALKTVLCTILFNLNNKKVLLNLIDTGKVKFAKVTVVL